MASRRDPPGCFLESEGSKIPTLSLDGDARGAVRATSDVAAGVKKLGQEFQKTAQSADQIREQLEKALNEQPIDTYIRKCQELAEKLGQGKINAYRYVEQTERLAKGLQETGEAREGAFGQHAAAEVAGFAAQVLGVGSALSFVIQGFEAVAEARKRAAENVNQAIPGFGELQNVGEQTPQAYAKRFAISQELVQKGIVKPEQQELGRKLQPPSSARACCRPISNSQSTWLSRNAFEPGICRHSFRT